VTIAQGVRARARAELVREITAAARRQLAADGAAALSVRAVARELGMVSSAVYRYFPSRDDLLTALIIEAYDALGEAAERADAAGRAAGAGAPARVRAVARAVRAWATAHPHEHALVYGSPVPGYRAPEDTIASATRVQSLLLRLLADAPPPAPPASVGERLAPELAAELADVAARAAVPVPAALLARGMAAWNLLVGSVSLELFGHYANTIEDLDALFELHVDRMLELLGYPPDPGRGTAPGPEPRGGR
jgi:AcrR family transcriptional regulator